MKKKKGGNENKMSNRTGEKKESKNKQLKEKREQRGKRNEWCFGKSPKGPNAFNVLDPIR